MLDPQSYANGGSLQYRRVNNYLNSLKNGIQFENNEEILDVGSGDGRTSVKLLLSLLPHDAKLVGGDFHEMVMYAKKNINDERVSFKVMDIEDVELKNQWESSSFNKIFTFYCEHWINNHRISFSNYHHLLKPDGRLYVVLADYNNSYGQIDKELSEIQTWKEYNKELFNYKHLWNKFPNMVQFYHNLLIELNFEVNSVRSEDTQEIFLTLKDYYDFSKGISLVAPSLPENLIEQFMEDYKNLALKHGLISIDQTSGKVIMNLTTIYIEAIKK